MVLACIALLLVTGAWSARSGEGRRLALLISVRETREPRLHRLWFSDDDVTGLAAALPNIGFASENVTILTQQAERDKNDSSQPTRSNIRKTIKKFCKEALPDDTVLIAFSGHGVQLRRDGRIYFCPPEASLADVNTLLALDDITHELSSQCKAKLKLLLVDLCRNDPTDGRPDIPRPPEPDPPPGIAVFLGCAKGQQSLETGKVMHGIFFYHVIQGILGAARDVAGDITINSLEDYLEREVPLSMQRFGPNAHTLQTPELHSAFRDPVILNHIENAANKPLPIRAASTSQAAPFHALCAAAYNKINPSARVDFRTGGLSGLKALKSRTALAVASDAPISSGELDGRTILQIPTVSLAVLPICNLPGFRGLTLDARLLADIYLGKVQNWNDPRISVLNPGAPLPDLHIIVVHPADDSNTARTFSDFLSSASDDWRAGAGSQKKKKWPVGAPGKGTEDIARIVSGVEGTIGFVEFAYAEKVHLFTLQTGPSIVRILSAESTDPYPIRATTYLVFYQDLTYLKDRKLAEQFLKYVRWCSSEGMQYAGPAFGALTDIQRGEVEAALKSVVLGEK